MDPQMGVETDRSRVVTLLTAIVVLLVFLVAGLGATALYALRAAAVLHARQEAVASGMAAAAATARQALARFEERKKAISGDPGGPLGRLDRQIQLMSIMVDEQMVLVSQLAGIHEAAARALGPELSTSHPQARAPARHAR